MIWIINIVMVFALCVFFADIVIPQILLIAFRRRLFVILNGTESAGGRYIPLRLPLWLSLRLRIWLILWFKEEEITIYRKKMPILLVVQIILRTFAAENSKT